MSDDALCRWHLGSLWEGMSMSTLCTLPEGHEGDHVLAHPRRDIDSGRILSMYGLEAFRAWLEDHPEMYA